MTYGFDEEDVLFHVDAETLKKAKEKAKDEGYDTVEDYAQHLIYRTINEICPYSQSYNEIEDSLRTAGQSKLSEDHIAAYCQHLKGKSLLEIEKILSIPHDKVNKLIGDVRKIVNEV